MVLPPPGRHAPSSPSDDEGVRVLHKPGTTSFSIEARAAAGVALVVGATVAASLWWPENTAPVAPTGKVDTATTNRGSPSRSGTMAPPVVAEVARRLDASLSSSFASPPAPSGDPDDLASYFRPGDPVPSTANLIKALNGAGIRTGIAAFNPPGTSPPLEGLAVPADFQLPPGYVRHLQATDEGEPIEPILMFSPDLVLRDAQGRPIELPADRVVPPELAPPGLPLRWVRPGKP